MGHDSQPSQFGRVEIYQVWSQNTALAYKCLPTKLAKQAIQTWKQCCQTANDKDSTNNRAQRYSQSVALA